jgi:membrane carboxypeptidase/penicillin-binding protein
LLRSTPENGSIRALVGGFDFNRNKFNHVTQAWRQPGSSFKPFIYSASLEKGYSPSSIINDEPIVINSTQTGSQDWAPHNYDGKYEGPMKMRTGAGQVQEYGIDPYSAGHRYSLCSGLRQSLWFLTRPSTHLI